MINWSELIIGGVIGVIFSSVFGLALWICRQSYFYILRHQPTRQLWGDLIKQTSEVKFFIRDNFITDPNNLYTVVPRQGIGTISNVQKLWSEVDSIALSLILNCLGDVGKTKNIKFRTTSKDEGEWNCNMIVIGGQSTKSYDFYSKMEKVAYSMDDGKIYNHEKKEVTRKSGYGYGIIIKTKNPFSENKSSFLVGGFGVLGTEAAAYYFKENQLRLGKKYKDNYFGLVVRASVSGGYEAVEFVEDYVFSKNN